jgi:hypothetical protein
MLLRVSRIERIATGCCMGINKAPGFVFEVQVTQHCHQRGVLEHIGMIAGVKGVSVSEHGAMVPDRAQSTDNA